MRALEDIVAANDAVAFRAKLRQAWLDRDAAREHHRKVQKAMRKRPDGEDIDRLNRAMISLGAANQQLEDMMQKEFSNV